MKNRYKHIVTKFVRQDSTNHNEKEEEQKSDLSYQGLQTRYPK